MEKDISQIALERIKASGLKPLSKNVFNIKRVIFWSLVGTAVLIGAVAMSVNLSLLFTNDWYLYHKFGLGFIFRSLPYFWFGCLILFLFLGEYYYRKTLIGYRRSFLMIIGIYILLTTIVGSIFYLLGLGESFERSLSKNIPIYRNMVFDRDELWSHPEQGLISGKIIEVNGPMVKILDLNQNIRIIHLDNIPLGGQDRIKMGHSIKIIGDQDLDDSFSASQLMR